MKSLIFDTKEKYQLFYEALSVSQLGYRGGELVTISKVFAKLQEIGDPIPNEKGWTLKQIGTKEATYPSIDLEDAEFALALQHFDSVPFNGIHAMQAASVYEWLHSIK